MRIFLDTSVLSELKLLQLGDQIVKLHVAGDEFYLSVITHFQVLWGYFSAGLSTERYERLLEVGEIGIAPLTKLDVEVAAGLKPSKRNLLGALISATFKRYDGSIWTSDKDFMKFLPKTRTKLI
jgi:predicted nucleic acid-binding protein